MTQYRVVFERIEVDEEYIEASSFDEAKAKWEDMGLDAELVCIESDEEGTMIYL